MLTYSSHRRQPLLCNRYTCRCGEDPPADDERPDWTPWWSGFAANA